MVETSEESEEESESETEPTPPMPDPSGPTHVRILLRGVRHDRTRSPRPSLRRGRRMSIETFSTDANGSM